MNILVIDPDSYLGHKIILQLERKNHTCVNIADTSQLDCSKTYDIVIYSFDSTEDLEYILKYFKNDTIILLGKNKNEILENTLKYDLADYFLKPFLIDHLFQKINHYYEFNHMKQQNNTIDNYLKLFSKDYNALLKINNTPPFIVEAENIDISNKFIYLISKRLNQHIKLISYKDFNTIKSNNDEQIILYMHDFDKAPNITKKNILKNIESLNIIIYTQYSVIETEYKILNLNSLIIDSFLSINGYVELVINKYKTRFTNIELSQKLGISRKTLWQKKQLFKSSLDIDS